MTALRSISLPVLASSVLVLSSCVIKDGGLDFTWWKDTAAPVMEDDVVIESGGGYYRSSPAPERVPLASIPREQPEQPAPSQPAPPTPVEHSTPGHYVVQPGDTLTSIARRYRTSVNALVTANNMASASVPLRVNQSLRIPTGTTAVAAAAPKPRPATPPAAKPAPAPAGNSNTYTVKAGDTLYRISRQYGVNPAALMRANGLTPTTANTIRVGSTLRIPATN